MKYTDIVVDGDTVSLLVGGQTSEYLHVVYKRLSDRLCKNGILIIKCDGEFLAENLEDVLYIVKEVRYHMPDVKIHLETSERPDSVLGEYLLSSVDVVLYYII